MLIVPEVAAKAGRNAFDTFWIGICTDNTELSFITKAIIRDLKGLDTCPAPHRMAVCKFWFDMGTELWNSLVCKAMLREIIRAAMAACYSMVCQGDGDFHSCEEMFTSIFFFIL